MNLREYIRDIPDYPKPGITFFDITPILSSPKAFGYCIDMLAEQFADCGATQIVGAEARGFIFGAPLALKLNMGFIPVRKPGKLPYKTREVTYDLEYGTDTLCMHIDAVKKDEKILIIDDLIATGGTAAGMVELVREAGGEVVGFGVPINLSFLPGKDILTKLGVSPYSIIDL